MAKIYKKTLLTLSFLGLFGSYCVSSVYAWKFAVMGDTRPGTTYDHSQNVYGVTYKVPVSNRVLVFENGDLTQGGTDSQWQNFRSIITPLGIPVDNSGWIAYGIPKLISAVGNHDVINTGWQSRWQTYLPAQAGLSVYQDIPADPQGLFGSVKYQNAIFVWANYNNLTQSQTMFLNNTLVRAKTDPTLTWKFVTFHGPPVSCNTSTHSDWTAGKAWHDNYFYPNGVDMIFMGDNHFYERTCPFRGGLANAGSNEETLCDTSNMGANIINPNGVIHVISGGGGAELYPIASCPWLAKKQNNQNANASIHQFMDIEINGSTLHTITWDTDTGVGTNPIMTSAQAANLLIIDEFTITKGSTRSPSPTPTPSPTGTPRPTNSPSPSPLGPSPTPVTGNGDADGNGTVNVSDVKIVLSNWLFNLSNSVDQYRDTKINTFDFAVVAKNLP